jgi:hypothetical protein
MPPRGVGELLSTRPLLLLLLLPQDKLFRLRSIPGDRDRDCLVLDGVSQDSSSSEHPEERRDTLPPPSLSFHAGEHRHRVRDTQ